MKRAFLFGLTAQLTFVSLIFLILGDQMIPMARSPLIGAVALCCAIAAGYFAWKAPAHPSWPVRIGMWFAGFLALYAAIPVVEVGFVVGTAVFSG